MIKAQAHSTARTKSGFPSVVAALFLIAVVILPQTAVAQCEQPGQTLTTANGVVIPKMELELNAAFLPPAGVVPAAYLLGTWASKVAFSIMLKGLEMWLINGGTIGPNNPISTVNPGDATIPGGGGQLPTIVCADGSSPPAGQLCTDGSVGTIICPDGSTPPQGERCPPPPPGEDGGTVVIGPDGEPIIVGPDGEPMPNASVTSIPLIDRLMGINRDNEPGRTALVVGRMRNFWQRLYEQALKPMTGQLAAGVTEQGRHFSSLFDSSNLTDTARTIQKAELKSKKENTPTVEGCYFDTAAPPRAQSVRMRRSMESAIAKSVADIASSKGYRLGSSASAAARGPGQFAQDRFSQYNQYFCDREANAGASVCDSASQYQHMANRAVTPSRTLFAHETMPLSDVFDKEVKSLTYNLLDVRPRRPFNKKALESSSVEKEKRNRHLSYIARMNAAAAPLSYIIGERTAGPANSADLADYRLSKGVSRPSQTGVDGTIRMSEKDIQQTVIEQLWDPGFYARLNDSPATVMQKENYLQAYNTMMMYKLLEKTERIALIWAVQTANMLEAVDSGRDGAPGSAPVRSQ